MVHVLLFSLVLFLPLGLVVFSQSGKLVTFYLFIIYYNILCSDVLCYFFSSFSPLISPVPLYLLLSVVLLVLFI